MSTNIYNPGQAEILFDVWPNSAEWFVIGGPANANEAQTVVARHPHMKCVGFEPEPEMFRQQRLLNFPGDLHPIALWNERTSLTLKTSGTRWISSSVLRDEDFKKGTYSTQTVSADTLDNLESRFGPWNNIVLWLDIECAELQALQGAQRLLREGKVLLLNVEAFKRHLQQPLIDFVAQFGMSEVKRWNVGTMPGMCELIFAKES